MTIDRNQPDPVYLTKRKGNSSKRLDKARRNQLLDERKTMINQDFWDKFLLLAKVCYMHDKDSDIYDVFETYRTNFMGGWESSPEQLSKLDAIIAKEEGYGFAGV